MVMAHICLSTLPAWKLSQQRLGWSRRFLVSGPEAGTKFKFIQGLHIANVKIYNYNFHFLVFVWVEPLVMSRSCQKQTWSWIYMSQIMNLIYPSHSRTFRFESRSLIFNVNITIDNFPSGIDLAQASADGLY